jgi:hypothetical protein
METTYYEKLVKIKKEYLNDLIDIVKSNNDKIIFFELEKLSEYNFKVSDLYNELPDIVFNINKNVENEKQKIQRIELIDKKTNEIVFYYLYIDNSIRMLNKEYITLLELADILDYLLKE